MWDLTKPDFVKSIGKDFLLLQVSINDIIYEATNQDVYYEFFGLMCKEFKTDLIA